MGQTATASHDDDRESAVRENTLKSRFDEPASPMKRVMEQAPYIPPARTTRLRPKSGRPSMRFAGPTCRSTDRAWCHGSFLTVTMRMFSAGKQPGCPLPISSSPTGKAGATDSTCSTRSRRSARPRLRARAHRTTCAPSVIGWSSCWVLTPTITAVASPRRPAIRGGTPSSCTHTSIRWVS